MKSRSRDGSSIRRWTARRGLAVIAAGLAAFAGAVLQAQEGEKLAPYFPTPMLVVDRMLQLGGLKAGEKMWDLGSGDGRIVILAAQKYKADAWGVEFDESLAKQSMERIRTLGLQNAHIVHGDMLKTSYEGADLITVYLLPVATDLMTPLLERELKPGARVVAHDFEFTAWKPVKIEDIDDDGEGRAHRLYLYQR